MADGIFPSLVSRTRDVNAAGNVIFVQLSDGSAVLSTTGGALDVNVDNTVTVSATQLDIDDLVAGVGAGEDNVLIFANTVKDGSGTDFVPLVDTDGHLQIDVLTAPAVDFTYDYAVDSIAGATDVGAFVLAVRDDVLTTLTPADGDYVGLRTDSIGRLWTTATLTNTELTPIYVTLVSTTASGEEIHDYDTSVNVAVDTADNHDYTVAGTTFFLKSVIISASGNIKAEILTGPLASLVTKAVIFLNGRQGDTQQIFFDPAIEVPVTSTGTVRIARTNRQGATMDVYSTIIGSDV